MKEEQKLNESRKPKLDIFGVMYRLFADYKKSINWFAAIMYYTLFTIVVLIDGCTWYRFFGVTSAFIVVTLFAWLNYHFDFYK